MKATGIVTYDQNNDKEGIVNPITIHDEVSTGPYPGGLGLYKLPILIVEFLFSL